MELPLPSMPIAPMVFAWAPELLPLTASGSPTGWTIIDLAVTALVASFSFLIYGVCRVSHRRPVTSVTSPQAALRRVSLAFDWNSHGDLQSRLRALTAATKTDSADGRHRLAVDVTRLMREALADVRSAFVATETPTDVGSAFRAEVARLHARHSSLTHDLSAIQARPAYRAADRAGRFVVVTVVIAVEGWMAKVSEALDVAALDEALETMIPLSPSTSIMVETGCSQTDSLGADFPELRPMSGARVTAPFE